MAQPNLTSLLQVRLPDGSRSSRRFLKSSPLQAVFDYVDTSTHGELEGARPGSYRLVMQYPRRVYEEGEGGSLGEVGLDHDCALFVQAK